MIRPAFSNSSKVSGYSNNENFEIKNTNQAYSQQNRNDRNDRNEHQKSKYFNHNKNDKL